MIGLAWGGHANGRIPLASLEYVAAGAISGAPQYLHPHTARRWRNLVARVLKRTGVRLALVEGYRDHALQLHYWGAIPYPGAAYPGTSRHGWGRAVDMGNYGGILAVVREEAIACGFDLSNGMRVNEAWHLEDLNQFELAGGDSTSIPLPAEPEEEDDDMRAFLMLNATDNWKVGDKYLVTLGRCSVVSTATLGALGITPEPISKDQFRLVLRDLLIPESRVAAYDMTEAALVQFRNQINEHTTDRRKEVNQHTTDRAAEVIEATNQRVRAAELHTSKAVEDAATALSKRIGEAAPASGADSAEILAGVDELLTARIPTTFTATTSG